MADLIDAPGTHSIRVLFDREGEIEAPSSKRDDEMLAMAEAAFVGAEPGLSKKDKKDAAMGAAMNAATAFMATSGLGQELTLGAEYEIGVGAGAAALFWEDLRRLTVPL